MNCSSLSTGNTHWLAFFSSTFARVSKGCTLLVNVGQLVSYLELRPSQINEVGMINDYFREKQSEGLRGSHKMRDKRMRQAVFGNLKLMKKALSTDQYRKYVALINVTNNNNRMMSGLSFPDVYLADK